MHHAWILHITSDFLEWAKLSRAMSDIDHSYGKDESIKQDHMSWPLWAVLIRYRLSSLRRPSSIKESIVTLSCRKSDSTEVGQASKLGSTQDTNSLKAT